jgi:CHASE2 domain-containing sensor protein
VRQPSTRVVAAVVFGAMGLTLIHFTDNAVNVDEYPKAGWQPDWFEWVVVAGWFVYSAIGVAGYRFYRERRYPAAHVALVVYGVAVASSVAHFLYGSPADMPVFSAVSVFVDLAAGLAVIGVAVWSRAGVRASLANA